MLPAGSLRGFPRARSTPRSPLDVPRGIGVRAAGHRVASARVVGLDGSGPREPGATMVVNDAGEVAGSVSGGCVEGAVVGEALAVLEAEGGVVADAVPVEVLDAAAEADAGVADDVAPDDEDEAAPQA